MAIQQWTWANFYQGISEDRYFWAEKWLFQANFNIDTQSEPRWARLQWKEQSQYSFDASEIKLVQRLEDWFDNQSGFIHIVDQKLYKNWVFVWLVSSWVTGWQRSTIAGNAYVLIFGQSLDIYAVWSGTLTLAVTSLTSTATARPSLSITWDDSTGSTTYVWVGNIVKQILHTGATTVAVSDALFVQAWDQITGITRYNTEFRVYTKSWNSGWTFGKQYMWDWASTSVTTYIDWNATPILSVASAGMIDYVIAGKSEEYSDLYIATGTERKLVRTWLGGGRARRFSGKMHVCKDIVYILWTVDLSKFGETSQRQTCIFSYGTENAWFPKGLQIEYVWDSETDVELSYCNLYAVEDKLYIGKWYQNATPASYQTYIEKRLDHTTDYATSGSIISNTFTGGVLWAVKDIKQINIWYSLASELGHGGSIKVYYRPKSYGSWTELATITDDTVNYHKIYENQIVQPKFSEMELKIELIADGDKTPFIYEVTTIYDDNLRA